MTSPHSLVQDTSTSTQMNIQKHRPAHHDKYTRQPYSPKTNSHPGGAVGSSGRLSHSSSHSQDTWHCEFSKPHLRWFHYVFLWLTLAPVDLSYYHFLQKYLNFNKNTSNFIATKKLGKISNSSHILKVSIDISIQTWDLFWLYLTNSCEFKKTYSLFRALETWYIYIYASCLKVGSQKIALILKSR